MQFDTTNLAGKEERVIWKIGDESPASCMEKHIGGLILKTLL
jgi:hypothetical protein